LESPSELNPNFTFDCPKCGAKDSVRLSIPHLAEQPLRVFGLRPYRCRGCRGRFYRNWPVPPGAEQVLEEPTGALPVSTLPPAPAKLVRPNTVSAPAQPLPRTNARAAFRNAPAAPVQQAIAAPAPQQMQVAAAPSVRGLPGARPWVAPRPLAKPAVVPNGNATAALDSPHIFPPAPEADASLPSPIAEDAAERKPSFDYAAAARQAYRRAAGVASRLGAGVERYWTTRVGPSLRFCLVSFSGLVVVHFLVGSLEFQPLGAAAMWVNLLSLVTLISAMLVYVYLCRALRSTSGAVATAAALVMGWSALFFGSEVVIGWFVVPGIHGFAGDVAFFHAQAPWIWMTYPVLLVSGVAGCVVYLIRGNKPSSTTSTGTSNEARFPDDAQHKDV
jgi:hypothetical protein